MITRNIKRLKKLSYAYLTLFSTMLTLETSALEEDGANGWGSYLWNKIEHLCASCDTLDCLEDDEENRNTGLRGLLEERERKDKKFKKNVSKGAYYIAEEFVDREFKNPEAKAFFKDKLGKGLKKIK